MFGYFILVVTCPFLTLSDFSLGMLQSIVAFGCGVALSRANGHLEGGKLRMWIAVCSFLPIVNVLLTLTHADHFLTFAILPFASLQSIVFYLIIVKGNSSSERKNSQGDS